MHRATSLPPRGAARRQQTHILDATVLAAAVMLATLSAGDVGTADASHYIA